MPRKSDLDAETSGAPGLKRIYWTTERKLMRGLACVLSLVVFSANTRAEDWRQFRGNESSGVSAERNLPTRLDQAATLKWKSSLPGRGLSGPVVIGDRVFLTASSGYRDDQLHVLCFSAATGELLWDRQFKATGRT